MLPAPILAVATVGMAALAGAIHAHNPSVEKRNKLKYRTRVESVIDKNYFVIYLYIRCEIDIWCMNQRETEKHLDRVGRSERCFSAAARCRASA